MLFHTDTQTFATYPQIPPFCHRNSLFSCFLSQSCYIFNNPNNKKENPIFGKANNMKTKTKSLIISSILTAVILLLLNYLWPTPWNIHSIACFFKLLAMSVIIMAACLIHSVISDNGKNAKIPVLSLIIISSPVIVLLALVIGLLSGAQIFNASKYANIISVETVNSADMILSQDDTDSIALMDTASARQLGDREIGSIENFSAFNVSDDYIQLNVNGDAVKIAPLEYAGFFKWMKNKDKGVTGYVTVSPTTMTADYIALTEGMNYVPSAYFSHDLNRYIHKTYPTLIYDNIHFEIDEDGNPRYIASVYKKTVGLLSGDIVTGIIIVDPVSGETALYDLADVPAWVDNAVPGNLICELYNLAYKNKNGFWNGTAIGANTGCMQVTKVEYDSEDDDSESGTDFGYIAQDGDIYIYTGVTSMAADSSNLGFIMVNERTGQYRYIPVSGANEQSAINAAEGEVQQYSYIASFPTLINVDSELTYIGVLKDYSGLVKMYYMVNVKDYGKVVVATSREDCVNGYIKKLGLHPADSLLDSLTGSVADDSEKEPEDTTPAEEVSFTISVIQYVDIDGNTYVYMGCEDGTVYKARFADNEILLFAKKGTQVSGTVKRELLTVTEIK